MKPHEKLLLCKRCNKSAIGNKKDNICKLCFKEIVYKYKPMGRVLSPKTMDIIEEEEQLCEKIWEETYGKSERELY